VIRQLIRTGVPTADITAAFDADGFRHLHDSRRHLARQATIRLAVINRLGRLIVKRKGMEDSE
jgi:hypothetical protein